MFIPLVSIKSAAASCLIYHIMTFCNVSVINFLTHYDEVFL